ncbi:MAG: acetyl-CoA carboxylase biotin carboxyl carrier protein [Planctomycetes bacterium]|nr:acetyl-CoA carboxylase biotin carboxyl carrier protein [Planctomycetota bacterium]
MVEPKDIKKYVKIMEDCNLTELEVEEEGFKVKLKRSDPKNPAIVEEKVVGSSRSVKQSPAESKTEEINPDQGVKPEAKKNLHFIRSPIVGTFYRAPSPGANPFVKEGDNIDIGSVLCVIEAMKVMNELKTDRKGKIHKVLVKDAQLVEFDQPLFELEAE